MWKVQILNKSVQKELDSLPEDLQAKFHKTASLIKEFGLDKVHEPYVKHLLGKLWEMRMTGKDGIARAIYVAAIGKRVVVVRIFVKKTQKTPKQEIDIALERARSVE